MAVPRTRNPGRLATEAPPAGDASRQAEAIVALEKMLVQHPGDAKVADRLGDLHVRAGDLFAAISHYRKAADAYERDDRATSAIAVWRKAIRIRPELIDLHVWLADLYVRVGKPADAKRVYETLLEALQQSNLLAMPVLVAIIKKRLAALESPGA